MRSLVVARPCVSFVFTARPYSGNQMAANAETNMEWTWLRSFAIYRNAEPDRLPKRSSCLEVLSDEKIYERLPSSLRDLFAGQGPASQTIPDLAFIGIFPVGRVDIAQRVVDLRQACIL